MLRAFPLLAFCCLSASCALSQDIKVNNAFNSPTAGPVKVHTLAEGLDHPWGMALLPSGDLLFSERSGALKILRLASDSSVSDDLAGVPAVYARGQGGLLDVALDPDFANNQLVYLSYAEGDTEGMASTALGRGRLVGDSIAGFEKIFTQLPKVSGKNHFGSRIVFDSAGMLFFTMAERFKFDPAQDLSDHLGTIVRLHPDGRVPEDNPFVGDASAKPEIWSYGHRNIQAAAIDPSTGRFWEAEFGPLGGDELNLVERGKNYGWPLVSWGKDYDGKDRPDPPTRPEFQDAAVWWTPTISPSGMIFYTGDMFPGFRGSALIGGLTASGIVRVEVADDGSAKEVERLPLGARIRDIEQATDGALYVLTDADEGKILLLKAMEVAE